jgi:predicted nucleotidyltransferase
MSRSWYFNDDDPQLITITFIVASLKHTLFVYNTPFIIHLQTFGFQVIKNNGIMISVKKMKILGIIAEYNPFHNGHALHLKESLALSHASHSLAVMSGPFVQRGEPALLDPYKRARMAVDAGVNLVLELPVPSAILSAGGFSEGAVKALDALGIVDSLVFGSESDDLEDLKNLSDHLQEESPRFKATLKQYLDRGESFMGAREKALRDLNLMSLPLRSNDILGLEYLKALKRQGSAMVPLTIQRQKADYHDRDLKGGIASATAIRRWYETDRFDLIEKAMPPAATRILREETHPAYLSRAYPLIRYALLTTDPEDLKALHDVREGLENRLIQAAATEVDFEAFMTKALTKRLPRTRIQRVLLYLLLALSKNDIVKNDLTTPHFLRVLGADRRGLELIRLIQRASEIPLIVKEKDFRPGSPAARAQLALSHRAQNLRSILASEPFHRDYTTTPYIKKK